MMGGFMNGTLHVERSGQPCAKNQLKTCWSACARVTSVEPAGELMGVATGPPGTVA